MQHATDHPAADLERTRQIALAFLAHCFRGEMEQALALLSPEATWWVLGDPAKVKVAGVRDRRKIEQFMANIRRGFPTGLDFEISGVTAEGERVAIEATSSAITANGLPYRNQYHFLVQVRDGQVIGMREYLDTLVTYELQQASLPPPRP